jgi:hypothetical protein
VKDFVQKRGTVSHGYLWSVDVEEEELELVLDPELVSELLLVDPEVSDLLSEDDSFFDSEPLLAVPPFERA